MNFSGKILTPIFTHLPVFIADMFSMRYIWKTLNRTLFICCLYITYKLGFGRLTSTQTYLWHLGYIKYLSNVCDCYQFRNFEFINDLSLTISWQQKTIFNTIIIHKYSPNNKIQFFALFKKCLITEKCIASNHPIGNSAIFRWLNPSLSTSRIVILSTYLVLKYT